MKTPVVSGASVLALAATIVSAQNTTSTPTPTATGNTEPCALVSSTWAIQSSAATATPTAEASLVYKCLQSVPLDREGGIKFLDALVPYIEWQSDTAFKKNPPAEYFYPPHDIWAEFSRVRDGVAGGKYDSEYAWQADFYKSVFGPAHDGHFVVYPDVLTNAVEWARQWALVSISEEGSSLPVIKVYNDIVTAPDAASAITHINGIDAVKYLSDWIFQVSSNQEPDSAYNSLFWSKAYNSTGTTKGYFQSGGRPRYVYPGETTSLTFENGTEVTLPNVGRLKGNWDGVTDGPSFYKKFAPAAAAATATSSASIAAATASVPGYPKPNIISSDGIVSGYYLDGDLSDTAVLVMTSFSPRTPVEFQRTVQDFFAAAVADGKKNLVIDVQVNGGGYIFQGYDTFRQLFPDIVQNGTGRWRSSPGFKAVANVTDTICANYDPLTATEEQILTCEATWNWRYDLDVNDKHFDSYDDKFGPVEFNADEYTDVMQWDFNNPLDTINSTYGIGYDVTGYRSRANFTRPFAGPENIVLLLDGYCASTCTLFSQFLKYDAGVKSIAMGGRPKKGPIQGVGGVKGSQSNSYSGVYNQIQLVRGATQDPALLAEFDRYTTDIFSRASALSLNVKDEILPQNLDDGTPAQFIQEDADCRLYWTSDMHTDITNLWKAAATAAFKGGKCAAGSLGAGTPTTRSEPRPAPFNKPRFRLPKQISKEVPRAPVARRAVSEKVQKILLEQQHMMVID